jgi:hypothetical protein
VPPLPTQTHDSRLTLQQSRTSCFRLLPLLLHGSPCLLPLLCTSPGLLTLLLCCSTSQLLARLLPQLVCQLKCGSNFRGEGS